MGQNNNIFKMVFPPTRIRIRSNNTKKNKLNTPINIQNHQTPNVQLNKNVLMLHTIPVEVRNNVRKNNITRNIAPPFKIPTNRSFKIKKTQATIQRELARLEDERLKRITNLRTKGLIMSRNERQRFVARTEKIRSQK